MVPDVQHLLLGDQKILVFFIEIICWHPDLYRFRTVRSLQFFLEHSLEPSFKNCILCYSCTCSDPNVFLVDFLTFSFSFFYCCSLILNSLLVGSLKCLTSQPLTCGGHGVERHLNSKCYVAHFCEYGRYFLIGYYLSETGNLLLLAERTKENIQFSVVMLNQTNNCCVKRDLRVNLSSKSEDLYHSSN